MTRFLFTTVGVCATLLPGLIVAQDTCDVVIDKSQCDETKCAERCGLHGATYLLQKGKCCAHYGKSAALLAFEEDEKWVPRIAEFNQCTGASVRLEYLAEGEDGMADEILRDVGDINNPNSGEGIFDAYIAQAPWLPAVEQGLADLSGLINENSEFIQYLDINPASRSAVTWNGTVKALPLDTDYVAIGWREDVFAMHGFPLEPPKTIEELADLSEALNGLDHNGDGEPDWGFCLTPQVNYFYAFVAPVFQTNLRQCVSLEDCISGPQTGQNLFFDAETFSPLIWNEGFRYAFEQYWRIIRSSNCQTQIPAGEKCDRKTAFRTGRCAGVISMPGTMTNMLKEDGKYSIIPRMEGNTTLWAPGTNLPEGRYWGRRARFPGSSRVMRWANEETTPGDDSDVGVNSTEMMEKFVSCEDSLDGYPMCPHAESNVNFVPFFAEGGESYTLNGRQSKPAAKQVMFDFFTWMAQLPVTELPLSGQYRKSHLDEEHRIQLQEAGWPETMIDDLFSLLGAYFRSEEEGGNPAQDLLMLGFSDYMSALDVELHDNLLLGSVEEGGLFDTSDPSASLDPLKTSDVALFNERYSRFLLTLQARYDEITGSISGGRLGQLQRWRQSLNLPWKSDEELCSDVLVKDAVAFDELNCESHIDFLNLCITKKEYVELYRPGTCAAYEEDENTIASIRWIGWGMGIFTLSLGLVFFIWCIKHRNAPIIRASQPIFLITFNVGVLVMNSAIFPLGIDDSIASQHVCDVACMASPWLFFNGFALAFSALFAKIWRLNTLVAHALAFRRISVTERDVLWPLFIMMVVNVVLLVAWTFDDPLRYSLEASDLLNYYGICRASGNRWQIYLGCLVAVNMSALFLANIQAYKARGISDDFSESQYIGIGMASMLQMFIIGVPLYVIVEDSPPARFLVAVGVIFVICSSLQLLIFVPKIAKKVATTKAGEKRTSSGADGGSEPMGLGASMIHGAARRSRTDDNHSVYSKYTNYTNNYVDANLEANISREPVKDEKIQKFVKLMEEEKGFDVRPMLLKAGIFIEGLDRDSKAESHKFFEGFFAKSQNSSSSIKQAAEDPTSLHEITMHRNREDDVKSDLGDSFHEEEVELPKSSISRTDMMSEELGRDSFASARDEFDKS